MSERDQSPGPRHEAPGQQPVDWRENTTPGLRPAGSPQQGAGEQYGNDQYGGGQYGGGQYGGGGDPYAGSGGQYGSGGAPYSGAGASAVSGGTAGRDDDRSGAGYAGRQEDSSTTPQYSTSPVTVRRPAVLAALLLVLAGIAAAVSLLLDWVSGSNGWDLVTDGIEDFDAGSWQPPVIVLAGGVLLVLGLLLFLPARRHRTLGVLALLATMAAAGGVLVVLNLTQFDWDFFEIGFWIAAAVPVLGLLGSLKAMLSGPKVR